MAITAPANFTCGKSAAYPGETVVCTWTAASGDFDSYWILVSYSSTFRSYYPAKTATSFQLTLLDDAALNPVGEELPVSIRAIKGPQNAPTDQSSDAYFSLRMVARQASPPTTPSSITASPQSVRSGELVTVSWGESTDPDGNLLRYELEKCVNGVWQSHYMGGWYDQQIRVEPGWKGIVQFRVRAVDTDGLYSEYAVSNMVTILADIFPDGGRLELLQNEEEKPIFPLTVFDGVFRRSDKKPLSAILEDAGAIQGPAGKGVPPGGSTGQVLAKKSNQDYDGEWIDPPESGGGENAGVSSFNGRSGDVTPQKGDYTAEMVGAISASQVQEMQVLSQTEYDALSAKSDKTLYLIKE